jgi:hypothetical protein
MDANNNANYGCVTVNVDEAIALIDTAENEGSQQQQTLAPSLSALEHPILLLSSGQKSKSQVHRCVNQDDEVLVDHAIEYLHWHALNTPFCPHKSGEKTRFNKCQCMTVFAEDVNNTHESASPLTRATARFIAFFAKLERTVQQQWVMGWHRTAYQYWSSFIHNGQSNNNHRFYQLAVLCDPENDLVINEPLPYMCMSAMLIIYGRKQSFWSTCILAVKANTIPEHGLIGKDGNATKCNGETLDDLRSFMMEIESLCEVVPTRFVRDRTGFTTRDDKETYTLPPYMSKKSLYVRWCYERGWNIESTANSIVSKQRRLDWPADEETQQILSWPYFLHVWKRDFCHITIRCPTADICDDCYLFYNQVKFKTRAIVSPFVDVDSTDEEAGGEGNNSDGGDSEVEDGALVVSRIDWSEQTTIRESDTLETMIEKASKHVRQAKEMRAALFGKAQLAREWNALIVDEPFISDSMWSEAVDCVVGDYMQNMGLPHLGEHQPGETYYFSPLTVNCFGLANVGFEKALLFTYIYHEGEAKKGGNNVASLIYKYLDDQGLINRGRAARKELNIVMDNCGGQNKNCFVLRLAVLFIELKYYRTVNIIFLVAGHTKNAADRLFNLLKIQYRKSQVYTVEQLVDVLNTNQYVSCEKVGKEHFFDFGKFEDKIYSSTPLSGNTKKYQLFYSSDAEPGVLFAKESNAAEVSHRMDLRKGKEASRSQVLEDFDIVNMEQMNDVEGIRKIKQVELYSKWRKHVPDKYKSPLYDYPGDDVVNTVKEDRKSKKKFMEQCRLTEEAIDSMGVMASRKSPPAKKKAPAKRKAPQKEDSTTTKNTSKSVSKKGKASITKPTAKSQQTKRSKGKKG